MPDLPEAVTLEVITTTPRYHQESVIISPEAARKMIASKMKLGEHQQQKEADDYEKMESEDNTSTGVHFLTDDEASGENYERKKHELLEYIIRDDGSVVCKLCGEVLPSRTHWYRHKYKFHVNNLVNPAPLFKCKHCNVFFKSRKGYMGHLASRHSAPAADDAAPPLPQPAEAQKRDDLQVIVKEEADTDNVPKQAAKKKLAEGSGKSTDWEEKRVKEEQLVAAIIDRVRKECEAQGATVTRRGYSRRSTVMMNST